MTAWILLSETRARLSAAGFTDDELLWHLTNAVLSGRLPINGFTTITAVDEQAHSQVRNFVRDNTWRLIKKGLVQKRNKSDAIYLPQSNSNIFHLRYHKESSDSLMECYIYWATDQIWYSISAGRQGKCGEHIRSIAFDGIAFDGFYRQLMAMRVNGPMPDDQVRHWITSNQDRIGINQDNAWRLFQSENGVKATKKVATFVPLFQEITGYRGRGQKWRKS